jgi:hypothetical protein
LGFGGRTSVSTSFKEILRGTKSTTGISPLLITLLHDTLHTMNEPKATRVHSDASDGIIAARPIEERNRASSPDHNEDTSAGKMPCTRKFTRIIGKNRSDRNIQCCREAKDVYQSHRRYVYTLVMNEIADSQVESEADREQKWNALESILFLSDLATQEKNK